MTVYIAASGIIPIVPCSLDPASIDQLTRICYISPPRDWLFNVLPLSSFYKQLLTHTFIPSLFSTLHSFTFTSFDSHRPYLNILTLHLKPQPCQKPQCIIVHHCQITHLSYQTPTTTKTEAAQLPQLPMVQYSGIEKHKLRNLSLLVDY